MPISVYITCTEALKEEALYCRALEMVSPARKEKALRCSSASVRAQSLAAELLLRRALSDAGIDPGDLHFEYGPHGKPYLPEFKNIHFNLSHSGSFAMAAVSENEIGCDIEKIKDPDLRDTDLKNIDLKDTDLIDTDLKIARRFFTRGEYERITALPDAAERNILFFRYWTLKESFLKVTGLGMHLPLDSFEIYIHANGLTSSLPHSYLTISRQDNSLTSSRPDSDLISVRQNVDHRHYHFAEIDLIPGYRCAVCAAGDAGELYVRQIDLPELLA